MLLKQVDNTKKRSALSQMVSNIRNTNSLFMYDNTKSKNYSNLRKASFICSIVRREIKNINEQARIQANRHKIVY